MPETGETTEPAQPARPAEPAPLVFSDPFLRRVAQVLPPDVLQRHLRPYVCFTPLSREELREALDHYQFSRWYAVKRYGDIRYWDVLASRTCLTRFWA